MLMTEHSPAFPCLRSPFVVNPAILPRQSMSFKNAFSALFELKCTDSVDKFTIYVRTIAEEVLKF